MNQLYFKQAKDQKVAVENAEEVDTPRSHYSSVKSEAKAESESAKRIQHIEYLVEKS